MSLKVTTVSEYVTHWLYGLCIQKGSKQKLAYVGLATSWWMTLWLGDCHFKMPLSRAKAHLCCRAANSVSQLRVTAMFFTCVKLTLQWRGEPRVTVVPLHAQTIKKILQPMHADIHVFFLMHMSGYVLYMWFIQLLPCSRPCSCLYKA